MATIADDTRRSFQAGERVTVARPRTIADGLAVTTPGRLTFPINHRVVDAVVTVTDAEVADTGDIGDIGVVLSGGNTDLPGLARIVGEHRTPGGRPS